MKTKAVHVNAKGNTYFDKRSLSRPAGGCWLWEGSINDRGYPTGIHWPPADRGRTCYAHRYAYTRWVGEIPEGLTIDHLCENPACVNPDHLEAVAHEENNYRRTLRKKFCKYGHPYTKDSRMKDHTSKNGTICRECMRAYGFRSRGLGTFEEGLAFVEANPIDRTPKEM